MKLTAEPAFVFIADPALSVECTVSWETNGRDFALYVRARDEAPVQVVGPGSERKELKVSVRQGDVLTFALYEAGKGNPDPTFTDPPADALASIYGLADMRGDLITSFEVGSGGTYIGASVRLKEEATVTLEVSDAEPVDDPATRMLTFPYFLASHERTFVMGAIPLLEAKPLLPGNLYSVIIRAIDLKGRWQAVRATRATKRRTVTGEVIEIIVDNCGDSEEGEAQFWVEIGHSGREDGISERILFKPTGDKFPVRTNQRIALPINAGEEKWTFDTGRMKITGGLNDKLVVRTNGIEHDDPPDGDERASGIAALHFPTGAENEKFEDRTMTVKAVRAPLQPGGIINDPHKFAYRVRVRYSADYS